jgi:hypothetical protein
MSLDFERAVIKINASANYWGPFEFDFTDAVPAADTISSVAVTSTKADGTSSSTELIETGPSVSGDIVSLRLQYPGATMHGEHTLYFVLTMASTAVSPKFSFGHVVVEA